MYRLAHIYFHVHGVLKVVCSFPCVCVSFLSQISRIQRAPFPRSFKATLPANVQRLHCQGTITKLWTNAEFFCRVFVALKFVTRPPPPQILSLKFTNFTANGFCVPFPLVMAWADSPRRKKITVGMLEMFFAANTIWIFKALNTYYLYLPYKYTEALFLKPLNKFFTTFLFCFFFFWYSIYSIGIVCCSQQLFSPINPLSPPVLLPHTTGVCSWDLLVRTTSIPKFGNKHREYFTIKGKRFPNLRKHEIGFN